MNWYVRSKIARRSARNQRYRLSVEEVDEIEEELTEGVGGPSRRARLHKRIASDIVRIRKRTTLDSVLGEYIGVLAGQIQKERPDLSGLEVEVRKDTNLGFRFTKRSLDGAEIEFFVDCTFSLAPEHIKIGIKGAKDGKSFSSNLRLFLYDPLMKTARRISGNIPPTN